MSGFKDLTGKKFGELTVTGRAPKKDKRTYWECKCSCGAILIRRADSLKDTSSCKECLKKVNSKRNGIDEVGNTYGFLTVSQRADSDNRGIIWECYCSCGNPSPVFVHGYALRNGHTSSCGCYHSKSVSERMKIDELGNKHGKLTVIAEHGSDGKRTMWLCECDCKLKNKKIVSGIDLRAGRVTSCGCIGSRGEYEIEKLLVANSIRYETQYTFPDCKDKNLLRFDFAIFSGDQLSHLIEYQGEQHFQDCGGYFKDAFEAISRRDSIKKKYCISNNIPLIYINYNETISIDKLLI